MDEREHLIAQLAMCRRAWAAIMDDSFRRRLTDYIESLEDRLSCLDQLHSAESEDIHSDTK